MLGLRLIPVLLLTAEGLVKTVRFGSPRYVGDPINAVRIFNEKEVDELVVLDIEATRERRGPRFEPLEALARECFMPLCYGGGVGSLEDIRRLVSLGVEKVAINSAAQRDPELLRAAAERFGSSTLVVSIDVRRGLLGAPRVFTHGGRRATGRDPVDYARQVEGLGAGEILLNSIDRDGTLKGYDLKLIESVASAVQVPVIACGGAGSLGDVRRALDARASAAAAGSLFVFHGKHRAVLINYPRPEELERRP